MTDWSRDLQAISWEKGTPTAFKETYDIVDGRGEFVAFVSKRMPERVVKMVAMSPDMLEVCEQLVEGNVEGATCQAKRIIESL